MWVICLSIMYIYAYISLLLSRYHCIKTWFNHVTRTQAIWKTEKHNCKYVYVKINAQAAAPFFDSRSFSWNNQNFLENSSLLVSFELTTFRLHAEYTYVYKCIHRYICLGLSDHIIEFLLTKSRWFHSSQHVTLVWGVDRLSICPHVSHVTRQVPFIIFGTACQIYCYGRYCVRRSVSPQVPENPSGPLVGNFIVLPCVAFGVACVKLLPGVDRWNSLDDPRVIGACHCEVWGWPRH